MSGDSDLLLEHIHSPYHEGLSPDATTEATAVNPLCGDEVRVQLSIAADRVEEAWFTHQGCAISRAGASLLCATLEGLPVAAAARMTDDDFLSQAAVQLSPIRRQCFLLARQALRQIVDAHSPLDSATTNR